ncbi:MAG: phospholipase D-like domain-containing protein [Candidatus Woesearchaeota archaeon]
MKAIDKTIIFLVIVISIVGWTQMFQEHGPFENSKINSVYDKIEMEVFFCPRDDCREELIYRIEQSEEIRCAFFDIDDDTLIKVLAENEAQVVIDEDNAAEAGRYDMNISTAEGSGYMHNKFCVFDDDLIMTGSMNPTGNGMRKNNNNAIYITSDKLAQNYLHKFEQMFKYNIFKDDDAERRPFQKIEDLDKGIWIENHFCPEDRCEAQILRHIEQADDSIHFMTFSFTSKAIAEDIIEKMEEVRVKGIFENWGAGSEWSQYQTLNRLDTGNFIRKNIKGKMHHKVFIIDEKTIITGSYNPSKNANTNNDENIVIIHDKEISKEFLEEFNLVWDMNGSGQ